MSDDQAKTSKAHIILQWADETILLAIDFRESCHGRPHAKIPPIQEVTEIVREVIHDVMGNRSPNTGVTHDDLRLVMKGIMKKALKIINE